MARGRKTCPSCNTGVGPRTKVCKCGHEFFKNKPKKTEKLKHSKVVTVDTKKPKKKKEKKESDDLLSKIKFKGTQKDTPLFRQGQQLVHIPSGPPPSILDEFDEDNIRSWVTSCLVAGKNKGVTYTANALLYWIRSYSEFEGPYNKDKKYLFAKQYIQDLYTSVKEKKDV